MIPNRQLTSRLQQEDDFVKINAYDITVPIHNRQVVFLEDELYPKTNHYIRENLHSLTSKFYACGYEFFYLPAASLTQEQMAYWNPAMGPKSAPLPLRTSMLYDIIEAETTTGHLPAIVTLCELEEDHYVLCGLSIDEDNPSEAFSRFFDLSNKRISAGNACSLIPRGLHLPSRDLARRECIEAPPSPTPIIQAEKQLFEEQSFEIDTSEEECSCCRIGGFPPDDKEKIEEELPLTNEEQALMNEIQQKLNLLRSHGLPEVVLERLFAPSVKASRIHITKNGTIILPDYNHTVIDMIPLDKVLYLLLLRHPEGIYQKDLPDHVEEMKELYCRINNGFLPNRALAGILNLASPLSNACNEKISRIRKVFQSHFQPAIAAIYSIAGGRAEAKKIPLDASYVTWE